MLGTRKRRVIGIAAVLFVVLLQACTQYLASRDRARVVGHLVLLAFELPALMGALGATSKWAVRRRLAAWQTLLMSVVVAGVVGIVFGLGYGVFVHQHPFWNARVSAAPYTRVALFGFTYAQLYFGIWTLAFVYPFAAEDARVRALEAERLRSAAELARLRAHLEPHFLLNTLNAIAGLVTEDPRRSRQLIASLGDLLRESLRDDAEMRPLERELEWLHRYADIVEARYAGAVEFDWQLDDRASEVPVPTLILQPLVENAIKHGALRASEGGHITVATTLVGNGDERRLVCTVEDDGPGIKDEPKRSGAFGLHAVRRRLELRCPGSELRVEPGPERGTRSVIELPLAQNKLEAAS